MKLLILLFIPLVLSMASCKPRPVTPPPGELEPYQYVWEALQGERKGMTRFFLDINGDNIPELFLGANVLYAQTGGPFHIFIKKETGYEYLATIPLYLEGISVESTSTMGYRDIRAFLPAIQGGGTVVKYIYNGTKYVEGWRISVPANSSQVSGSGMNLFVERSGPRLEWRVSSEIAQQRQHEKLIKQQKDIFRRHEAALQLAAGKEFDKAIGELEEAVELLKKLLPNRLNEQLKWEYEAELIRQDKGRNPDALAKYFGCGPTNVGWGSPEPFYPGGGDRYTPKIECLNKITKDYPGFGVAFFDLGEIYSYKFRSELYVTRQVSKNGDLKSKVFDKHKTAIVENYNNCIDSTSQVWLAQRARLCLMEELFLQSAEYEMIIRLSEHYLAVIEKGGPDGRQMLPGGEFLARLYKAQSLAMEGRYTEALSEFRMLPAKSDIQLMHSGSIDAVNDIRKRIDILEAYSNEHPKLAGKFPTDFALSGNP